jgi:hypothetical protein
MTADESQAGMTTLMLDERERSELLQLLEASLGDTRVEVHRTHTPGFREELQVREDIFRRLIQKLRQTAS